MRLAALALITAGCIVQAQPQYAPQPYNQPPHYGGQQYGGSPYYAPDPSTQNVVVNGVPLPPEQIAGFESQYRMRIPSGAYWYDPTSGAWGLQGGPGLGITVPGLNLGGPLRPDASGGGDGRLTNVFINGRELHPQDVQFLQRMVMVQQGRWWVDAQGNFGAEGGMAMGNLYQLAQRVGGGGKAYQRSTAGGYIGGDGSTSYFFDPKSGASVMSN